MRKPEQSLSALFLAAAKGFQPACWEPHADVYRTADGWLVKYELAGVRPNEVSVLISGATLLVRGRRRDITVDQGQQSYSMEISYSEFERRIVFPCELERMQIATDYRDGMLLVRLSKHEI
jgi:HSP20 family protein